MSTFTYPRVLILLQNAKVDNLMNVGYFNTMAIHCDIHKLIIIFQYQQSVLMKNPSCAHLEVTCSHKIQYRSLPNKSKHPSFP